MVEVFEKDEPQEKDEQDIGDIFGEEGEAQEDASKNAKCRYN